MSLRQELVFTNPKRQRGMSQDRVSLFSRFGLPKKLHFKTHASGYDLDLLYDQGYFEISPFVACLRARQTAGPALKGKLPAPRRKNGLIEIRGSAESGTSDQALNAIESLHERQCSRSATDGFAATEPVFDLLRGHDGGAVAAASVKAADLRKCC